MQKPHRFCLSFLLCVSVLSGNLSGSSLVGFNRFDFWSLRAEIERMEDADSVEPEHLIGQWRTLPNLNAYERTSLDLVEHVERFRKTAWWPARSEQLKTTKEFLHQLCSELNPDESDLYAAAHEATCRVIWTSRYDYLASLEWIPFAREALNYWGSSRDIETARVRYVQFVMDFPTSSNNEVSEFIRDSLRKALSIAASSNDKAQLHWKLAKALTPAYSESINEEKLQQLNFHYNQALELAPAEAAYGPELRVDALWHFSSQEEQVHFVVDLAQAFLKTQAGKEDSHLSRKARRILDAIVDPKIDLPRLGGIIPGKESVITLTSRNVSELRVSLVLLSWEDYLAGNVFNSLRMPHENAPAWQIKLEKIDTSNYQKTLSKITLPGNLAPGFYELTAEGSSTRSSQLLCISRHSLILGASGGQVAVFACDSQTGEPVSGQSVRLLALRDLKKPEARDLKEKTSEKFIATLKLNELQGKTDASGLARFKVDAHGDWSTLVAMLEGSQPALGNTRVPSLTMRDAPGTTFSVAGMTDRPVYRPGETVYWKAVLREYEEGRISSMKGVPVKIVVEDNDDGPIIKEEMKADSFGTVSGSFVIPITARLGRAEISIYKNADEESNPESIGFQIEEYRLPEFTAGISFDKPAPVMGEVVTATLKVSYYSGEPMPGARFEGEIKEAERELTSASSRNRQVASPRTLQAVNVTTDERGEATFSFETGIRDDQSLNYFISGRVSSLSNREIRVGGSTTVYPHRFEVDLTHEHTVNKSGEAVRIHVLSRTPQGTAASLKGFLLVGKITGERDCDEAFPLERLPGIPVTTNDDGRATVELPELEAGQYEVTWRSQQTLEPDKVMFWVGEPDCIYGINTFTLLVDEHRTEAGDAEYYRSYDEASTHGVGDTVSLLILAPVDPAPILLTTVDWKIRDTRVVNLKGQVTLAEVELQDGNGIQLLVQAGGFFGGKHRTDETQIQINRGLQPLVVTVEPDRESVLPGENQQLDIQVTHADGSASGKVPVLVSVFDQALLVFGAHGNPEWFHPNRYLPRYNHRNLELGFSVPVNLDLPGSDDEDLYELSPFTVSTSGDDRYYASNSTTGISLNMAIRDMPMSMEVLTSELLEDIGATDMKESLKYSAGVYTEFKDLTLQPVKQRLNFSKLAYWKATVMTDAGGHARVSFPLPDSLTGWRAFAWAVGQDEKTGAGFAGFTTSVPVAGRLQLPRFLVAGDKAELSVVTNNYTEGPLKILSSMNVTGPVELAGSPKGSIIEAGASERSDWMAMATAAGEAMVTAAVMSEAYSDAMQMPLEIIEHGLEQQVSRGGILDGKSVGAFLDLPAAHRAGSVSLEFSATAGLTAAMIRAMPYLIQYPYTCTEQTTSRLVPVTLLVHRLMDQGVDEDEVFNAVGFADAEAFQAFQKKSLERLAELGRNSYFGWNSPDYADDYMTAYAAWGLILFCEATGDEPEYFNGDFLDYLDQQLPDYDENPDMQAWMLFALANRFRLEDADVPETTKAEQRVLDRLLEQQKNLNTPGQAWTAMAADFMGKPDDAKAIIERLSKLAVLASEPGTGIETAHWDRGYLSYYTWSDHPVEATAWMVMAMARLDPDNSLLQPALNWLLRKQSGSRWESTRTTMIVLMAFEEARRHQEKVGGSRMIRLSVNGQVIEAMKLKADDLHPWTVTVAADKLHAGANEVVVDGKGDIPVYVDFTLNYFDQNEPIQPTESGIRVSRSYYRVDKIPTLMAGPGLDYQLLEDGDFISTGDLLEVRILIETATDLEYLILEDYKPAGFEAMEVTSGMGQPARELVEAAPLESARYSGRSQWLYVEPRDKLRACLIDQLPQGVWEIRYKLRAETPGVFHALPAVSQAMYSPRTRGSSAENRVEIIRE